VQIALPRSGPMHLTGIFPRSSLRHRARPITFGRFARRQPAAAFAGSVLAGFALSRFLKSFRAAL